MYMQLLAALPLSKLLLCYVKDLLIFTDVFFFFFNCSLCAIMLTVLGLLAFTLRSCYPRCISASWPFDVF